MVLVLESMRPYESLYFLSHLHKYYLLLQETEVLVLVFDTQWMRGAKLKDKLFCVELRRSLGIEGYVQLLYRNYTCIEMRYFTRSQFREEVKKYNRSCDHYHAPFSP